MSWCDKLASTPTVGFALDPHFAPTAELVEVFNVPILDKLAGPDATKPRFVVQIDPQNPFTLNATTDEGYQYAINPGQLSVAFTHRVRVRTVSSGPPILQTLSKAAPYTEQLGTAIDKLIEATLLLPGPRNRNILRCGIVTMTRLAADEMPPGITRFINYVGRPWKGELSAYNFSITAELAKGDNWSDRCTHVITKDGDPEELPSLVFDWQRIYAPGRKLTNESLVEITKRCREDALKYFEDLAEGSRFDEDILVSAA